MPSEPLWLPFEAVVEFNKQQVELTGENHALLFSDRLEGALLRPQNSFFYEHNYDIVSLSVNLMISIAQAHPFEQGNKRTGFVSGFAFIITNGYELPEEADSVGLAKLFTETIAGTAESWAFEYALKEWIEPR